MTDCTRNSDDISKKLSRRYLLRNSVITATGFALLPSFLTGCNKDVWDMFPGHGGPGGVGGVELTPEQLANAAANLIRLREWIADLYPLSINYQALVFDALGSNGDNENWRNFIPDIFFIIATGLVSATAAASDSAAAVPSFACLSAFLNNWRTGKDTPDTLKAEFAVFQLGQEKMQKAIEDKLIALADPASNYGNLTEAWKDNIDFAGKTYTIGDLANSYFPRFGEGDEYNKLQNAAFTYIKKALWNLVIMKCCTFYHYNEQTRTSSAGVLLSEMRTIFYPQYKGSYWRAEVKWSNPYGGEIDWYVYQYDLGIGGNPFPDKAANILFIDDTPGHNINPDALFNRSYVFQQFSLTKPEFSGHELGNDQIGDLNPNADDWTFTGGMFKELTH